MLYSELRREDNYNEYLRLTQNDDYLDVTFDEESGGVSAVHKLHKFGKQRGIGGVSRGDYERNVVVVLRKSGHSIVLEEETNIPGVKSFDGYLDDEPMEIKAIEGRGTWTISSKLLNSVKQRAKRVILYFPQEDLYSADRVREGIRLSESNPNGDVHGSLSDIWVVVKDHLEALWDKKATPIEGWSVWEGLRR